MPLKQRGPGLYAPTLHGCGVLFLLTLLQELEDSYVRRAVCRLHGELAAGASPRLVRLPDVVVLVEGRVVGEAASSSRHGLLNQIYRIAPVAGDFLRSGEARRKDVQTLVAREAELDRYSATSLDTVHGIRVIHGAKKAAPAEVARHGEAAVRGVATAIGRRAVDCRGARREEGAGSRGAVHRARAVDHIVGCGGEVNRSLRVARGRRRYVGRQRKHRTSGVFDRHLKASRGLV